MAKHVDAMKILDNTADRCCLVFVPNHLAVIIRQLQPTLGILIQIVAIAGVTIVLENIQSIQNSVIVASAT